MESNSKLMRDVIRVDNLDNSYMGRIIEQCRELAIYCRDIEFEHVDREANNKTAHSKKRRHLKKKHLYRLISDIRTNKNI